MKRQIQSTWEICGNILGEIEKSLGQEVQENKPIFGQMCHFNVNLELIEDNYTLLAPPSGALVVSQFQDPASPVPSRPVRI